MACLDKEGLHGYGVSENGKRASHKLVLSFLPLLSFELRGRCRRLLPPTSILARFTPYAWSRVC